MSTISTPEYLLDQAKRRLAPTLNNLPGLGAVEKRLLAHDWKQQVMVEAPPGGGLKPVIGDKGLPIIGHMMMFRGGPDYMLHVYQTRGPIMYVDSPALPAVVAMGPDAAQIICSNRNKDYSQRFWHQVIGPFFNRGLMLLDFEEHMYHRRIMQEAFTRSRLTGYVEHIDRVMSHVVAHDWATDDFALPVLSGDERAGLGHCVAGVHGLRPWH